MARLFVELLKDSLNEYAYDAEIAGVDYKIENTMYGIYVSIDGLHLTSRRPCWMARTMTCLSAGN